MSRLVLLALLSSQAGPEPWADPNLPVKAGLALWLDAARGPESPVRSWPDASGHRRDLVQKTEGFRPLLKTEGSSAVVRFDGRDDRLAGRGPGLLKTLTLVSVFAPHGSAGGYRAVASGNAPGKNDYLTGFNLDLGGAPRDRLGALNVEGAGLPGEKNLLGLPAPLGTFHVVSVTLGMGGPGSVRMHVDGEFRGHTGRAEGPIDLSEFRVGARNYSNTAAPAFESGFFHGDIAEILLYDRVLPEKELRTVEEYLRKKHPALLKGEALAVAPQLPVQMIVPGFTVKRLPVTLTNVNNLEYAPDGRLFALGYDGRIHVLTDSDGDGLEETVKPWWTKQEGDLRGPIGMLLAPEGLYVASKGKITLVKDTDGDGAADASEVVTTGWKEITQAVDAVGLAKDKEGNLYFGLGTANYANAYLLDKEGRAHYDIKSERGTILKVPPDRSKREVVCTGVRFTIGLAFNRHGDLFCTDQEGETWLPGGNPLDELLHIRPGKHYGFPPKHPKHLPDVADEPAVVTFGPQHQSTCGLKFNESREGWKSFGPAAWEGDALVIGESRGKIWRVPLVKTPAGYVGKPVLIGTQTMLTIDGAVSKAGDLVICCHSGLPDWGTGPKGEGTLFKISYSDPKAPQPVVAWPSGPLEVKVAFDRPVDPGELKEASITFGEFVSAADRLETLHPPYKVVDEQKRCPRPTLKVAGMNLSDDRRTLTISTASHPWEASYALTLSKVGGATVDLAYDLSGLEATWTAEGKAEPEWTGWIPHPDPQVIRRLTAGSADHERLLRLLDRPGTLRFRSTIRLPGRGGVVYLGSETDGRKMGSQFRWSGEPLDLRSASDTGKGFAARVSFRTELHPDGLPLRLEHFRVPWAPAHKPPRPVEEAGASPLGEGGDWARGKALFFGEAKCGACHTVRGEGGKVAPELTNLVHWAPARILREIVEPSATLNPDYVNHLVELKDGRRLTGVVLTEGADKLKIVDTDAKEVIVPRSDIAQMKPSTVSIMPDGLKALGEEKLRDLLKFLTLEAPPKEQGKAPPPRRKADVEAVLREATDTGPGKPREIAVVLVTGPKDHGLGEHDYPAWSAKWKELLAKSAGVRVSTSFKAPEPAHWEKADLMVFYFMDGKFWNDERYAALDAYLARGGGLVLLHSAVIPEKEPEKLAARIGLAWEWKKTKYRHGALDLEFAAHAVTRGLTKAHFVDESYWPLAGDLSKVEVLATAVEDGKPQPIIWARRHEKGRVVASILGHYAWTFEDPFARLVTLRAMAWAAGEPVDRFKALVTDGVRLEE